MWTFWKNQFVFQLAPGVLLEATQCCYLPLAYSSISARIARLDWYWHSFGHCREWPPNCPLCPYPCCSNAPYLGDLVTNFSVESLFQRRLMGKWETLEIQTERERMRILNDYVPLVFYMEIWPIWPDVWWFIMIYIYIYVCVCVDALSIASGFDVANISTINSLSLRWTRLQLNPPGYYCTGRSVKILRAVVRLGKDDAGQAIVFMFYFLLSTIYWMLFVWLIFFRCFPDGRWFSEMSTLLAGSHL